MLTIEIKLNGRIVAEAELTNRTGLSPVSDYSLRWTEYSIDETGIAANRGTTVIERHRRKASVWALVAKATVKILGQMIEKAEARP